MKQKVLLGLSGGVDSAVAALMLKKQGYEVICAFMRCFSKEKNKLTKECSYLEDKKDAQRIAAQLTIKVIELNYEKEYKTQVLDEMLKAYAKGITPNPDSQCNTKIKFPFLWKEAQKLGCQFIATGHYAKKQQTINATTVSTVATISKNQNQYLYQLKIPKDKSKDQTYFLYGLKQSDLKHTLFPIGNYTKTEVRKIAKSNSLHNWNKHGTKGLCFVGNINMKQFLKKRIKDKQGNILSPEGKITGTHQGIQFYTIGERIKDQNIQINKEYRNKTKSKLYIARKDKKTNTLTVAPENHKSLFKSQFQIKNINYITNKLKFPLNNIKVRIRHLGQLIPAQIKKQGNKIIVNLNHQTKGIAEGQSAVVYNKQGIMLAGGEIAYN